jgi:tagatose 1,6-diphosphate aldolase
MAMTTAERRGLQMISGEDGRMLVVACDQRGGMRQALTPDPEARKAITDDQLGLVKIDIARHLARGAAVLVDPLCALPRMVDEGLLHRETALLVGLDASGWDTSPEGFRVSTMVPGMSARRVRELGGTGGKVMVYLRSDAPAASDANLATLAAMIEDFAAEDLLLVTEFLTYPLPGEAPEAYAEKVGELAVGGVRLCLEAGANVLKIPYPGSPEACAEVSRVAGDVPWAVLSAGVDHATFLGQVETAMAHGASGVIAGRSLWKDCVSLDRTETRARLEEVARPRLEELRAVMARHPAPALA